LTDLFETTNRTCQIALATVVLKYVHLVTLILYNILYIMAG